jgi:hypothetical protein
MQGLCYSTAGVLAKTQVTLYYIHMRYHALYYNLGSITYVFTLLLPQASRRRSLTRCWVAERWELAGADYMRTASMLVVVISGLATAGRGELTGLDFTPPLLLSPLSLSYFSLRSHLHFFPHSLQSLHLPSSPALPPSYHGALQAAALLLGLTS